MLVSYYKITIRRFTFSLTEPKWISTTATWCGILCKDHPTCGMFVIDTEGNCFFKMGGNYGIETHGSGTQLDIYVALEKIKPCEIFLNTATSFVIVKL